MVSARQVLLCLLLFGCAREPQSAAVNAGAEPNPLLAPPVDSARAGSPEEVAAWAYERAEEADLDGDGTPERVVLTSDVTLDDAGRPLWEDGHRWAVFVESGAQRTLLYSAFVPNGHAESAIMAADSDGRRHVLIEERTPQQARSLAVAYEGPGRARSVSAGHYQIERWLPALHAAP